MNKFITSIKCSYCEEILTSISNEQNYNEIYTILYIDFKEGSIKYICPECNCTNTMELLSEFNLSKSKKLPKSKIIK